MRRILCGVAVTVAAAALAAISPPAASADVNPNIIGGRDATENYSFVADVGGCGGVLIDPQWVLTAGHCVGGNAPGRTVRVGSIDRTTGGTVVTRAKEVKHPRNDQGLIKLASPVAQKPAPLGTSAQPGTPIRLLGWGRTKTPGPSPAPRILQEVDTTIVVSPENCGTDPARICTDNPDGWRGACSGDSGAPAITKTPDGWVVTGTTIGQRIVQPYRCANVPQIYSNVPFHADWIKSVIDAG